MKNSHLKIGILFFCTFCLLCGYLTSAQSNGLPALGPREATFSDTGHGTQIGDNPYAGFSAWGAYPMMQQAAGSDPYSVLQLFGAIATGTNSRTASGNVVRSGTTTGGTYVAATITNSVIDGINITTGTASPISLNLSGTAPELYLVTTATTASLYFCYQTGTTGWVKVTGTGGP